MSNRKTEIDTDSFFLYYDSPSDSEEDLDPDYDKTYIALMEGNEDHIL